MRGTLSAHWRIGLLAICELLRRWQKNSTGERLLAALADKLMCWWVLLLQAWAWQSPTI